MVRHYITKYEEKNKFYAEAWLQINLFGKSFCFSKRRIELPCYDSSKKSTTSSSICDLASELEGVCRPGRF